MKKPRIYISSTASSKDNIKDAVVELFKWGFLDIELSGGTNYYEGIEDDLFKLRRIYGLNFLVHNYFPPPKRHILVDICSREKSTKNDTFAVINNAIRLTKKFGNELYTIHAGWHRPGQNSRDDFYKALDFLLGLDVVRANDMRIGVENAYPVVVDENRSPFLSSDDDIIDFLGRYKLNSRVGLLLDLGHLGVSSSRLNFDRYKIAGKIFADYPDKIFEVHLSENDGSDDEHRIPELDSWQVDLLKQNKGQLEDCPVVMEWWKLLDNIEAYRALEIKKIF